MAQFEGTIQEFHHYIGPRIKNAINVLAKKNRDSLNGKCEHCQEIHELQSAHVHGKGRRSIIESILMSHSVGGVIRCDIKMVEIEILQAHLPIEKAFKFLCQGCHIKYDAQSNLSVEPNSVFKKSGLPDELTIHKPNEKPRKWNLNLRQRWYETQIPDNSGSEKILFGITNHENRQVELGTFQLDYASLYNAGLIRKVRNNFRVRIYFDSPEFYISAKRPDRERLVLPIKYEDK